MKTGERVLIWCCIVIFLALQVVGLVSHGTIRHIVQTAPLWIAIVLATRHSRLAKWAALPCFVFWLLVMIAIWLFLLGWARIVSGTFSPTETAMTIVVGLASLVGIVGVLRLKSGTNAWTALGLMMLIAALQLGAFRLSLIPQIAHR
jgi:hypothetical protein